MRSATSPSKRGSLIPSRLRAARVLSAAFKRWISSVCCVLIWVASSSARDCFSLPWLKRDDLAVALEQKLARLGEPVLDLGQAVHDGLLEHAPRVLVLLERGALMRDLALQSR